MKLKSLRSCIKPNPHTKFHYNTFIRFELSCLQLDKPREQKLLSDGIKE